MGVLKNKKNKTKSDVKKKKDDTVPNGKSKNENEKVKKKKTVSCLQCIKPVKDGGLEGKYRVAAPELMQDTFMSDSEDEGGEVECPIQQQQQYRYMNSEAGTLHRAKPLEDSVTDGHLWPSNNDKKVATMERQPVDIGFLVSFVVDARGGAMKAKRRGGVRVIVPPAACAAPTRVTCRAATRRAPAAAPPPLMEGEALASRLLELQPQGAKFLQPVIIEVPIFTSSCPEREIVILRSDTGETWQDHYLHNNDNPMIQEALQRERQEYGNTGETLGENGERVTRIITCDFPHYLACVSRVRQEVHIIGPEGGTISSTHIPQVQAQFPAQALTKRIRVGLQAQAAARRRLPRLAAASPVVTVEPRRRKFHRSITLTVPLPQPAGTHEKPSTSNLRLLCSIMGGQARAVWEDVTGSTPLTITDDCASFTTTVSARFWLMNCQNVADATKLATELYRDMLLVPFEVRIVVLGKRLDALEGRLLVMYITDRYAYETLLQQEHYTEVAHSTSVKFLDGKEVYLEFSGNLVPVTKSGSQPMFTFEAFKDNRVEFTVRVKHHEETPSGRIYFMNEPKVPKGEQSGAPACVLDVSLPGRVAPRAGKSHADCLNLDQSGFDALNDELSFHWGDHNNSLGPGSLPYQPDRPVNGHDKIITNGDVKYTTEDTDIDPKDTKPQVNGGTLHVDSNKTKATFDSDEDKTPMNTLEKGKKKEGGGGFLGGLADKVKNVFSHSEDKEDEVKESSPKPQPKPRESKEKSPPKPAPRIINEELLGKVEDMFKDLHTKPQQKDDEDVESQVYKTKLVVDEDAPADGDRVELYEQYALMQPVDTPVVHKKSDPFQFYIGCCEGKFKPGQKHRHDETSNLVDIIEQQHFAVHEKLQDVSDAVKVDITDELNRLEKEKEDVKEKTGEVTEDIIQKVEVIKGDIKNKRDEVKTGAQDKLHEFQADASDKYDQLKECAGKIQDDIHDKAAEVQSNVESGIDNAETSAKDVIDHAVEKAGVVKDGIENKAIALNFAAMERAEELKNRSHETADNVKHKAEEIGTDMKNKAQDGANAVSGKAQEIKKDAKETVENVKEATNEKIKDLSDGAKEKSKNAKKEAKKKAKEGKNFFTGLVHNIFGEKEKIEDEVKSKIAEGKESANDLLDQASAKKDEIANAAEKKEKELQDGANNLVQNVQDKTHEVEQAVKDKKNEIEKSVSDKADEAKKAVESKVDEVKTSAQNTASDIKNAVEDKSNEVKESLQSKSNEIQEAYSEVKDSIHDKANEIKDKTSEVKDAALNKASEVQDAALNKASEVQDAIHSKTTEVKDAVSEKASEVTGAIENQAGKVKDAVVDKTKEIKDSVHDTTCEVKDVIVKKASNIKDAAQDKVSEVKDSVQSKASEVKDSIGNKASEFSDAVYNKASEASQAVHDTTSSVVGAVQSKKDEIGQAIYDKRDEAEKLAETEFERIRHEAEQTTDQIKKSAEDTLNAAADKKSQVQASITNKLDEIQVSGQNEWENLQQSASEKANDLQRSSKQAFDHVQDATLSTFDKVESSAKDRVSEARDTFDDLQSSARDTFADFKDDVHSSTQDTLRSFQSSAGNTFDSLDDSAREIFGGAQTNIETGGKELFSDMKESFEGFQVSADNKLEDIKGSAKDRLEEAGERLGEVTDGVREGARETEHAVADAVAGEADKFTSSLNNLGNSVFGSSGKGFMKDSSTKLLESEKAQSSPSPHKKSSGFFSKLRRNP